MANEGRVFVVPLLHTRRVPIMARGRGAEDYDDAAGVLVDRLQC